MIIDLCGCFASDFPLAYRWVGLKPFGHPVVKFLTRELVFLGGPTEI